MQVEKELKDLFVKNKQTLALAESCTGGALASKLTAVPGASEFFLGSIVAYCNQLKQKALRVSLETLNSRGAVSQEVVQEMLEGLFQVTNADWGIAVSGIAGPSGGSESKPVGTVWVAIGKRDKDPEAVCYKFDGSRARVIEETVATALEMLWRKVST